MLYDKFVPWIFVPIWTSLFQGPFEDDSPFPKGFLCTGVGYVKIDRLDDIYESAGHLDQNLSAALSEKDFLPKQRHLQHEPPK